MGNFFNKRQKVTSLFDDASLAMMYNEPGDDGKNFFEKKYDYYINGYQNISPSEKDFITRHPYLATRFIINRSKALEAVNNFEGKADGYGDAIRHCYWCALNQIDAGLNSPYAKELGDAHEDKPKNNPAAKAMDLHNNAVGYHLGNQAIINNWDEQELLNNVINAAKNGNLQINK